MLPEVPVQEDPAPVKNETQLGPFAMYKGAHTPIGSRRRDARGGGVVDAHGDKINTSREVRTRVVKMETILASRKHQPRGDKKKKPDFVVNV